MQIKDIYQLIIKEGIEKDPRGQEVEKYLDNTKKDEQELKEDAKKYFDQDKLFNPYSDTRILYGDLDREVKTIIAGIDIETQELLLADRLREKGMAIDLVLAHHPEGKALAGLYEVMGLQEDMLYNLGVPINVAQGILSSRISEVQRSLLPLNHNRGVDAARLLDLPFMCAHTPADNQVQHFLENIFNQEKPETVGDVVKVLKEIPEYQEAMYIGTGPKIVAGKEKNKAGKILVDMTGGTSGSEKAYEKMSAAGIGTIIGMHMGDKHREEAEKHYLNVIIAGHMASDSLGMNLLLDKLEKQGIEVITFSGLTRIRR